MILCLWLLCLMVCALGHDKDKDMLRMGVPDWGCNIGLRWKVPLREIWNQ